MKGNKQCVWATGSTDRLSGKPIMPDNCKKRYCNGYNDECKDFKVKPEHIVVTPDTKCCCP